MKGARGSGKAAPSSPSVDALAAIAARKAAKIEKSLNKVPAMQLIADQLAQENALKARQGTQGNMVGVKEPATAENVNMEDSDDNSDSESASSAHSELPEPTTQAQAQAVSPLKEGNALEAHVPSSVSSADGGDLTLAAEY